MGSVCSFALSSGNAVFLDRVHGRGVDVLHRLGQPENFLRHFDLGTGENESDVISGEKPGGFMVLLFALWRKSAQERTDRSQATETQDRESV